jgi:hypothetical protein
MKLRTDEDIEAAERFIDAVRRMRGAQKNYFRFRDGMMMAHARKLEQEVDSQLSVWDFEQARQEAREKYPELF